MHGNISTDIYSLHCQDAFCAKTIVTCAILFLTKFNNSLQSVNLIGTRHMLKLILPIPIAQMMKKRHKVERDLNIGDEVGVSKNMEAAKTNPQLKSMNKKFGMIHGLSSLANIMAFGSLAIHSWYLAGKLQF